MSEVMQLLKCPSCGGPLEPPAGESTMKCLYCGSVVAIPESLRVQKQSTGYSQPSIFAGVDTSAMVDFGTQWGGSFNWRKVAIKRKPSNATWH